MIQKRIQQKRNNKGRSLKREASDERENKPDITERPARSTHTLATEDGIFDDVMAPVTYFDACRRSLVCTEGKGQ